MAKNPLLKAAFSENEYTPENILDLKRCSQDPIYFMRKFIKVSHPTKGIVPFELYPYQISLVESIHKNRKVICLASRQLGKTSVVAMYILWYTLFNASKTGIIASKTMAHATEIMSRIKMAYEELPDWLKAGCRYFSRTRIEFDNGSKIKCEATSEKTGRGESPSILMVDEIAFISKRIQDEMWASLSPALSTGGKFIITSTPNGDSDLFANLWFGAMSKQNDFIPIKMMWYEHPDRTPESGYYEEMMRELTELKCRQEVGCEFLSSDALLINSIRLSLLKHENPVFESLGFKFWVTEEELGGRDKIYMVSMDPATGSGKDFTAIEIFDFPRMSQIGEYRSNDVNIPLMYSKLNWVLKKLTENKNGGRAEVLWTFERNGVGEAVSALYYNDENQCDDAELVSDSNEKFGIFTTGRKKILSALQLKNLVEKANDAGIVIKSHDLIHELKHYVSKGNSYEAKAGCTDDSVSALLGIMHVLKRLSEYNEDAFKRVNEYIDPEASMEENGDYAPFVIL
jgi:Terminase large subunit, T4likevirus-type, N-terminal